MLRVPLPRQGGRRRRTKRRVRREGARRSGPRSRNRRQHPGADQRSAGRPAWAAAHRPAPPRPPGASPGRTAQRESRGLRASWDLEAVGPHPDDLEPPLTAWPGDARPYVRRAVGRPDVCAPPGSLASTWRLWLRARPAFPADAMDRARRLREQPRVRQVRMQADDDWPATGATAPADPPHEAPPTSPPASTSCFRTTTPPTAPASICSRSTPLLGRQVLASRRSTRATLISRRRFRPTGS